MGNKLTGKVAVITGGNSGIGFATAKLFQAEGATVIITGRRQEAVDRAVKEIGGNSLGLVSDAEKMTDIHDLYDIINKKVGKIDILFLNAGVATFAPFLSMNEATFDHMNNVNVKGLFFNVQKAVPHLNEGASVVFNSSIAAQKGFEGTSVYAATKAAVRSLARTLARELFEYKIRVNSISPGPIDTPIFDKVGFPEGASEEIKEGIAKENPMKRMGTAEEIAKAVLFLASDDSSYIMGMDLTVDGGITQL